MKLKNILLTEGRSQSISLDRAKKIFNDNIREAYSRDQTQVYRAIKYFDEKLGFVEPAKADKRRKSEYTENYYTLILDNSPDWSSYPDRGFSISCTTSRERAYNQDGYPFLVLPFEGATVGIAPEKDLWYSFSEIKRNYMNTLDYFNRVIFTLFEYMKKNRPDVGWEYGEPQDNFQKFENLMEKIEKFGEGGLFDKIINEKGRGSDLYSMDSDLHQATVSLIEGYRNSNKGFFEYIISLFDPEKNGFELKTYKKGFSVSGEKEVWTSDPALLVRLEHEDEIMGEFLS